MKMERNGPSAAGERREVDVRRVQSLLRARAHLRPTEPWPSPPPAAGGGRGVPGVACPLPLLDTAARGEVEKAFVEPWFDIDHGGLIPTVDDYRDVPLLSVRPPDVARYFVRLKPAVLARFAEQKKTDEAGLRERE